MKSRLKPHIIAITLLLIGSLFLVSGIQREEHQLVEQKSNIICLECIGID